MANVSGAKMVAWELAAGLWCVLVYLCGPLFYPPLGRDGGDGGRQVFRGIRIVSHCVAEKKVVKEVAVVQ